MNFTFAISQPFQNLQFAIEQLENCNYLNMDFAFALKSGSINSKSSIYNGEDII